MRSITLAVLALIAADAVPLAAAADPTPPVAGVSVQALDRQGIARRNRRDRAELDRARVPARTAATPAVVRPAVGALRIALDPVTGKPGFEVVQAERAPEPSLDRSAQGLTVVRHADGSESVDLGERFMEYTVLTLDPQGGKQVDCVSSAAAAQRIVAAPAPLASRPAVARPASPKREK
jgi:hypothetical protein